jgi:hypothetical protein
MTHTLFDLPDVHLTQGEVVPEVILAKPTQPRLLKDRMRLHADTLLRDIRARIAPAEEGQRTEKDFWDGLHVQKVWETWGWAQHRRDTEYTKSFSLIVLGVVSDYHKQLSALPGSRVGEARGSDCFIIVGKTAGDACGKRVGWNSVGVGKRARVPGLYIHVLILGE